MIFLFRPLNSSASLRIGDRTLNNLIDSYLDQATVADWGDGA
jgi:hypothetical protein